MCKDSFCKNSLFKDFYSLQDFKSPNLLNAIQIPLPVSFILNPTWFKPQIEKFLEKYDFIKRIMQMDLNIFYIEIHKKELKKSPDYKEFNKIFSGLCEMGLITRQEIVSMMPVHFLNTLFKKHTTKTDNKDSQTLIAVDLCASPGSKTLQLMNFCDLIVANDTNPKRLNILTTNIVRKQRYLSKKSYTIQTSYDAKSFPLNCMEPRSVSNEFDFVLCDVPCSGDGTAKKNPHLIDLWEQPINLVVLQYRILKRGVEVFLNSAKTERYLVYSTCSMNPLENEFVVECVLRRYRCLELVGVREGFGGDEIKCNEGLSKFEYEIAISNKQLLRVRKDFEIDFEDEDALVIDKKSLYSKLLSFERFERSIKMKYNFDNSELKKCCRFMPTAIQGGFFVAIFALKKTKENRIPNKPRAVDNLVPGSISLKGLEASTFKTNSLLTNSTINNTLFELPTAFKKYLFPLTEFAGIIRAVKEKKATSNLLIKNLETLTGKKKIITKYRLKNVNQLKEEESFAIGDGTFMKILQNNCFLKDLLEDDLFVSDLSGLINLKASGWVSAGELKEVIGNVMDGNEGDRFDYDLLLEILPVGPSLLNYKGLIFSCRISGKVEAYMNERERNLILLLSGFQ